MSHRLNYEATALTTQPPRLDLAIKVQIKFKIKSDPDQTNYDFFEHAPFFFWLMSRANVGSGLCLTFSYVRLRLRFGLFFRH